MPMKNLIEYKRYQAELFVDASESIIYGRVINIERDIISFHADTIEQAKAEFVEMIDEYLEECAEDNVLPDQPKIMAAL